MRGTRGKGKFTLAQREACYAIYLQPGMNQHKAADILSNVGYGRLPPFSISPASVYRIARELRASRAPDGVELARTEPLEAVDQMTRDAVTIAQRALARLESKEANGKLEPKDMRDWLAVLRDLRAQATKVRPRADKPHEQAKSGDEEERSETAWLGADEGDVTHKASECGETDHATKYDHDGDEARSRSLIADSGHDEPIPIEHDEAKQLDHAHMA